MEREADARSSEGEKEGGGSSMNVLEWGGGEVGV